MPLMIGRLMATVVPVAVVAACAMRGGGKRADAPDDSLRASVEAGVVLTGPRGVGTMLLLGIDFPETGTVIGGHYSGQQFLVRQQGLQMTELAHRRWSSETSRRVSMLLRGRGYTVQDAGLQGSDPQALRGVRFALSGRVASLDVRTSGDVQPHRVDVRAGVTWELLDVAAGSSLFGLRTTGEVRDFRNVDSAVVEAVDRALASLLAEEDFIRALGTPRPRDLEYLTGGTRWESGIPGENGVVTVSASELNVMRDSSAVKRVAAGVVTLRGRPGRHATAIVLTRHGLAISTADVPRDGGRLWARFPNGVERPVRVLRTTRRPGLALLHVSCPDPCVTTDWIVGRRRDQRILVVGAPFDAERTPALGHGEVLGSWGLFSGNLVRLRASIAINGGEPVADTAGVVFAMAVTFSSEPAALSLVDVFRALNVRVAQPR